MVEVAALRLVEAIAVCLVALLVGLSIGGVVGWRKGGAEARAKHAALLAGLHAKTEASRTATHRMIEAYREYRDGEQDRIDKEKANAFDRGKAAAAGIAAGTVRVHTVWRDRECPAADAGQGAELPGWGAEVPEGRADAIGRVLGHGGAFDLEYGRLYGRLMQAQKIVDACFDEPSGAFGHGP